MRNDVKLGLAVGGILLAVLIVYVLVVPGSQQPGAELVTTEGATTEEITLAPEEVAGDASTQSDPSREPVNPEESVAVPPGSTGEVEPAEEVVTSEGNDPFRDNTQANAGDSAGWDWNKLLNPADTPELMSPTRVSTGNVGGVTENTGDTTNNVGGTTNDVTGTTGNTGGTTVNDGAVRPTVVSDPQITQAGPVQPPAIEPIETQAPKTEVVAGRTHKVAEGETFSSIAAAAYGASRYYPHIMRANPTVDPSRLKPGTVINLPAVSEVKPAGAEEVATVSNTSASAAKQVDSKTEYRVVSGDSLEKISIKLYGKRDRLNDIYELNKEAMDNDPARLKIGQVLKLPATPTITVSAN